MNRCLILIASISTRLLVVLLLEILIKIRIGPFIFFYPIQYVQTTTSFYLLNGQNHGIYTTN